MSEWRIGCPNHGVECIRTYRAKHSLQTLGLENDIACLASFQLKRYDALGLHYWSKGKPQLLLDLPDNQKKLTIKPPKKKR